jgi:hypothetical protein
MKKYLYLPLFILLAISLASCQSSDTSNLQATNDALSNQVNTLSTQVAQQASSANQSAQQPAAVITESNPPAQPPPATPTQIPPASPTLLPTQPAGIIAPSLIVSGSGEIFSWSNTQPYPMTLFGAANVHLVCDPGDTADGKIWIDSKNYSAGCNPNSESWTLWKQDITVGDHYIYSQNAADKYEFWTVGTTPFTIRNKYESTDFMFNVNTAGIYNLTANLVKGAFNVYITCEGAQNFNYKIIQSTTIEVVLNPARCEIIVRDSPPGTVTPGEIEVSLVIK